MVDLALILDLEDGTIMTFVAGRWIVIENPGYVLVDRNLAVCRCF